MAYLVGGEVARGHRAELFLVAVIDHIHCGVDVITVAEAIARLCAEVIYAEYFHIAQTLITPDIGSVVTSAVVVRLGEQDQFLGRDYLEAVGRETVFACAVSLIGVKVIVERLHCLYQRSLSVAPVAAEE